MTSRPWNMRPDETAKAYQAFEVYRDMGAGRSTAKVGQVLGKSKDLMDRWSGRFDWVARAHAADEAAAAKRAEGAIESAADVLERQAKHAKVLQLRAMQKFAAVAPEDMTVAEATRAWQVGAEAERKAMRIPDTLELTGKDGGPMEITDGASPAERMAALAALYDRVRDRVDGSGAENPSGETPDR